MSHHRLPNYRIPTGSLLLVLLVLVASLAFSAHQGRAATSVSASLNPSQFSVDDNAVLTITVNGSSSAALNIPQVAGLSLQRQGQSSRVQIINGSFSSSISYTYIVQADNPGTYTIPPIRVSAGGGTLSTAAISFQVTRPGSTPSNRGIGNSPATRLGSGKANQIAFIRVNVDKKKSWIGEVIPIQIRAYFRQSIKANVDSLPILKGDGFIMPQLDQKPPQTEENVGGTDYSVLTWNTTISAVKEGKHTLSLELDATLLLPQRSNPFPGFGDQDFFQDNFFQNFFGRYRSKNVKITSRPITIESKQLPTADQPADFSGAIGHFKLSVQAKPDRVAVGDPITLDMIVSGEGNFDRVETPKFPEDRKWKSYPPSSEFKQGDGPTKGRKKFEQAIVVKDDRVTEIPSLSFTFFDPTAEKYETLRSGPIPLTVKKSAPAPTVAAQAVPSSPSASPPKTQPEYHGIAGLVPIHLELGTLRKRVVPLFARTWFLMILLLCAVLLITVFCWKIRLRQLERNPNLRRKKMMYEILARNMTRVKETARQNDSRLYLAACRKAIQEVLGNRWQTEASAITLADLQARLDPSSRLIAIFAAAEQVAYARYELSAEQIREYTDHLHKELSELQ
jgi:BatD DUF11 like domain